jgi:hypothetical protein
MVLTTPSDELLLCGSLSISSSSFEHVEFDKGSDLLLQPPPPIDVPSMSTPIAEPVPMENKNYKCKKYIV